MRGSACAATIEKNVEEKTAAKTQERSIRRSGIRWLPQGTQLA